MNLQHADHPLLQPLHTSRARLVALSGIQPHQRHALHELLEAAGHRVVSLRPPTPWHPLAPLHHLCALWEAPFPSVNPERYDLPALWLGWQIGLSDLWTRLTQRLQGCPTFAWIAPDDLHAPLWRDFLWLVRHQQLALPLCLLLPLPDEEPAAFGIQRIPQRQWRRWLPQTELATPPAPPALDRHAARYLTQLQLLTTSAQSSATGSERALGDLRRLSRAHHERRLSELRDAGLLTDAFALRPEALRDAPPAPLPTGARWRKRAATRLARRGPEGRIRSQWLRLHDAPPLPPAKAYPLSSAVEALFGLGPEAVGAMLRMSPGSYTEEARLALLFALSRTTETLPPLDALAFPPSLALLAQIRTQAYVRPESLHHLAHQCDILRREGPSWAAALATAEQVQWSIAQGQMGPAFRLLAPYRDSPHWAIRWRVHMQLSRAYSHLKRADLARDQLERAVATAPRPLNPLLAGELRLATSQLLDSAGHRDEATEQRNAARQVFQSYGDGARLGRTLLLAGEEAWRCRQWEEARNLLGRALDLCRRYHDNLGLREAQLKLSLVIKEVSHTLLERVE